ncbi:hypothetical protein CDAR_54021 [Caerostris darwini]|uniref:Uncharacterized protein n=1 Tax=Caerostris darwini TaxID=1538125 RepID=A0AAV4WCZ8_9ARAC|nr:hypothetical protein CDAR_54021 [Caerostris darwini]
MKSANNCAKFTITINSEERKFKTIRFEILINQTTDDTGWRCPVAFVHHSPSPLIKRRASQCLILNYLFLLMACRIYDILKSLILVSEKRPAPELTG